MFAIGQRVMTPDGPGVIRAEYRYDGAMLYKIYLPESRKVLDYREFEIAALAPEEPR